MVITPSEHLYPLPSSAETPDLSPWAWSEGVVGHLWGKEWPWSGS